MEVVSGGVPVVEVAERYGVARKAVHAWLRCYEAKLISGIDDHSCYPVIGKVVPRASARAVCAAFMAAMAKDGVPGGGVIRADLPGTTASPNAWPNPDRPPPPAN